MAKHNFGTDFGLLWPKFGPKMFFVGFASIRCYTLLQAIFEYNSEPILRKWQLNLLSGPILAS